MGRLRSREQGQCHRGYCQPLENASCINGSFGPLGRHPTGGAMRTSSSQTFCAAASISFVALPSNTMSVINAENADARRKSGFSPFCQPFGNARLISRGKISIAAARILPAQPASSSCRRTSWIGATAVWNNDVTSSYGTPGRVASSSEIDEKPCSFASYWTLACQPVCHASLAYNRFRIRSSSGSVVFPSARISSGISVSLICRMSESEGNPLRIPITFVCRSIGFPTGLSSALNGSQPIAAGTSFCLSSLTGHESIHVPNRR